MEEKYSNPNMYDQDEEEEALSFCDLPMYGSDEAEWEKFSKEDQSLSSSSLSLSSSSSEQDLFEFFCEDWSSGSSSSGYPVHENIIVFCGKLIPSKEPVSKTTTTHKVESNKEEKPRKRGHLSRWKLKGLKQISLSRDKPNHEKLRDISSSKSMLLPVSEKYGHKVEEEKSGGKYGFPVRRVSILASPPSKPRWNMMMFGLARLPAEIELSDIRSRQSRRSLSSAMVQPRGGGGGDEKVSGGGKWWWGMIRSLSCGGGSIHATAVAVQ